MDREFECNWEAYEGEGLGGLPAVGVTHSVIIAMVSIEHSSILQVSIAVSFPNV